MILSPRQKIFHKMSYRFSSFYLFRVWISSYDMPVMLFFFNTTIATTKLQRVLVLGIAPCHGYFYLDNPPLEDILQIQSFITDDVPLALQALNALNHGPPLRVVLRRRVGAPDLERANLSVRPF